jgi:hypothetical protein
MPDTSQPQSFTVQVVGKHLSRGRSTTYYLDLAPWGPVDRTNSISVPSTLYRNTVEGDDVCLDLHAGALHMPWYRRVACGARTDWNPLQ